MAGGTDFMPGRARVRASHGFSGNRKIQRSRGHSPLDLDAPPLVTWSICPNSASACSRRLPIVPPESRRSLAVVPLIADKRYYGEATARVWGGDGPVSGNMPPQWRWPRDEWLGLSGSQAGGWRATETWELGKRRGPGRGPAAAPSSRNPFHRVPDPGSRGSAYWEAVPSVVMRLRRGRGRGPLLGDRSTRQCAGRCESRWPCRLSARRSEQRKAR